MTHFFIKIKLSCLFILVSSFLLNAQDVKYARRIIEILSTPEMHGRGYVFKGDSIAAEFIKTEMALNGLKAFDNNFFQHFNLAVNTLPGNLSLSVNNNDLKPGLDFLVLTPSKGLKGEFRTKTISNKTGQKRLNYLQRKGLKGKVLIVNNIEKNNKNSVFFNDLKFYNKFNAEAVISLTDKNAPLTWGVYTGHLLLDFLSVELSAENSKKRIRRVKVDIENEYHRAYESQNVIGYVEGTKYPDSFFVFIGHYDHLGRMGRDTYFPGAHDNASGIALMLDLAGYYTENPPDYSIAFIAAAAEEAGLLGSRYYTQNPLFPLQNIKFLVNLDMVSTGEEGLMVVNGSVFDDEYLRLNDINAEHNLMADIRSRGEAANSDHYFFYAKGVKSFFFYTLGGNAHYHNVFDKPETLSLYAYNNLFKLITLFINDLSNN